MESSKDIRLIPGKQFCWISGMAQAPKGYAGPWWLQVAHLGSGSGEMRRVDDRRAVVLLCPIVHDLHVFDSDKIKTKRLDGVRYPTVDSSNLLWVKFHFDPEYYDDEYLRTIWTGVLPEPKPPHSYWVEQMINNQGIRYD